MAMKKRGGTTARPTKRPTIQAEAAPRPKLASGPLHVSAQGAILKNDARLILAVRVLDAEGAPVTGLKKANFKLWQLGHHFGDLSDFWVVELAEIAGLEGLYHLVKKSWSMASNGTIPFYVRAQKGALRSGGALTFIVKVRDGLDT